MRSPRVLLTPLVWLVLAGLAACGDNASNGDIASNGPMKITLDPESPKLAAGIKLDVAASYVRADLTATAATDVTWSVDDATVVTVTPGAGGHATVLGVKVGTTALTVAGQGVSGTFTVTVTPALLMSLAITPPQPSIAAGTSTQLTATGTFSDATAMNLSAMVTWSSSATATATVDSTGLLHGVAAGQAMITATLGTVSGKVSATVTSALLTSIQVTPIDPSLPVGVTRQFTATGVFSDSSTQDLTAQVTWSSNGETHATVSPDGSVTAVALGTATIMATKDTVSGTSQVTVTPAVLKSIAIDPPTPKVALGLTLQLTATGTFTDGSTQNLTNQVTWVSATETVAAVSATGLVTSAAVGTTQITATKDSIVGTTTLEVTAAIVQSIQVTPAEPTIAAGTTQQFTAIGTFSDMTTRNLTTQVTWTSSDANVATISNADPTRGLATSVTPVIVPLPATTTITATFTQASGNVSGSTTLHVSDATLASIQVTAVTTPPVNPTLTKGLTLQFVATGLFTDNSTQILTTQVTWDSSDPTVAAISNAPGSQGQATALAEGTTTITATFVQASGNVSGSTLLTVTPAVLLSIAVTPAGRSLAIGHQLTFTATGTFTDGARDITTQVTWDSDPAVATISNVDPKGVAIGVAIGTTTITATFVQVPTNVTGTTTLNVTAAVVDSIAIDPVDASLPKGRHQKFKATATLSDHNTEDVTAQVTWVSSDPTVASISNVPGSNGDATAINNGTTAISATFVQPSGNVTQSTSLTVTDAVLDSIAVNPPTANLAPTGTKQFTATGTFSDGTIRDLTTQVTWATGDPTVAQIDPTQGLATAVAPGTVTIAAISGTVTGTASLTVTLTLACDPLTDPANGTVSVSNGGIFPSTATYTCNGGFAPLGSTSRTCQADGTWSGVAPTCNAVSLLVVRVGDGAAALSNASTAVFVEQRSATDGSSSQTISLPTSGTPFTMSGTAISEGGLSRSANGQFVTLAGFAAAPGVASIATTLNVTLGSATNRVVARIDAAGVVDASTLLFNAFSGSDVRAATTIDGTAFWVTGNSAPPGVGGCQFVQLGSTGTTTHVLAAPDNARWVHVFDGQLYGSSASGASNGVFTIGTGTPTTSGAIANLIASATVGTTTGDGYGFVLLHRDPASAGPDTLYIALNTNPGAGSNSVNVQKWTFSAGAWTRDANFKPTQTGANLGTRGLAGWVDAVGVHIVATTNEAASTPNHLVSFLDDGTTETPAVTTLAASQTNTQFRGVALSPVP